MKSTEEILKYNKNLYDSLIVDAMKSFITEPITHVTEPITHVTYFTHTKPEFTQYIFHITNGEVADYHLQKQLNEYHENIPRPLCNTSIASYSIPIGICSSYKTYRRCKKCFKTSD